VHSRRQTILLRPPEPWSLPRASAILLAHAKSFGGSYADIEGRVRDKLAGSVTTKAAGVLWER